jgi:hypothetical protein
LITHAPRSFERAGFQTQVTSPIKAQIFTGYGNLT